jgi:hypothetical protein
MQPETPQARETVKPESNVNGEASTLAKLPTTEPSPSQQWRQTGKELAEQIVLLLERTGEVFREYKPAIIAIGLALAAMPIVAFVVALLAVINVIPLLAPALKLVGFGFTAWFVYRYLLFAPNRQELSEELQGVGKQVLGGQDSQMDFPETVPTQAQTSPDTPEPVSVTELDPESPKPNSESTSEPDSETSGPVPGQTPPNPPPEVDPGVSA